MQDYRYCPRCGETLCQGLAGGRQRPVCECGFVHWCNPTPAAAVFIEKEDDVLWVRRAHPPRRGHWSLPSGFQEWEEDIEDCARREAREETGLDVELAGLLGVYSVHDDPRGHTLLVSYAARIVGGEARPGDDAKELAWFPRRSPPPDIAWEPHRLLAHHMAAQTRRPDGDPARD